MVLVTLFTLLITWTGLSAVNLTYDKVRSNLRGIDSYEQNDYDSAIKHFEENVVNNPGEGLLHFNLGNAYYRLGEFDQAVNEYYRALNDKNLIKRSETYHNKGNALFEQQKYKEALESFRNALISDPSNNNARYNYELTRQFLEQSQNEQQPQSGDGDDEDDDSEQQDQSSAEESDSEDGDDDDVSEQQKGEGDQDQQKEQQQKELDEKKLEEAEKMLRTLNARERQLLEEQREREREAQDLRGRFW